MRFDFFQKKMPHRLLRTSLTVCWDSFVSSYKDNIGQRLRLLPIFPNKRDKKMELNLEHIAFLTFRELSAATRQHITVARVAWVLRHRFDYLAGLTYKQKCQVGTARIVEVVQRRLLRGDMHVSRALIRLVLQAEEACYAAMMQEEAALLAEENDAFWGQAA
jgi:hypothetical protein